MIQVLTEESETILDKIDTKLADIAKMLAQWRMVEDQYIMAAYEIVGMTTSFAASRQENLKELKPKVGECPLATKAGRDAQLHAFGNYDFFHCSNHRRSRGGFGISRAGLLSRGGGAPHHDRQVLSSPACLLAATNSIVSQASNSLRFLRLTTPLSLLR